MIKINVLYVEKYTEKSILFCFTLKNYGDKMSNQVRCTDQQHLADEL